MDPIRDAFNRVKGELAELRQTLAELTNEITSIKRTLIQLQSGVQQLPSPTDRPTDASQIPTFQQMAPTDNSSPIQNKPPYSLKEPNSAISIGNRGVPTDRQTDQQTDQQTQSTHKNRLQSAAQLFEEFNDLKSEVRLKFKSLTDMELVVFTTIYQLQEEGQSVDYSILARKLSLSESSIRDYTLKIGKKGIPLIKQKENNKRVILSIDPSLKNMISLGTLLRLKEL